MQNVDPMTELKTITMDNGDLVTVRTLGTGDMFAIMRMVGTVLQSAADRRAIGEGLADADSVEDLLAKIIMTLAYAENQITLFLESLVGRDKLSLTELGKVLEALADHKDLINFLASWQRIKTNSIAAKKVEKLIAKTKFSTSSNVPMAGQTNT